MAEVTVMAIMPGVKSDHADVVVDADPPAAGEEVVCCCCCCCVWMDASRAHAGCREMDAVVVVDSVAAESLPATAEAVVALVGDGKEMLKPGHTNFEEQGAHTPPAIKNSPMLQFPAQPRPSGDVLRGPSQTRGSQSSAEAGV